MALIKCPECGQDVSDQAAQCIHCGYPLKKVSVKNSSEEKNVVKCPKCGSTSVTTGARGVNWMWGAIGASQTVNRCAKCGHTWKP